jgi:hypothetical protein
MGISTVKDVSPDYTTDEFFTNREEIAEAMKVEYESRGSAYTDDALTV